MKKYYALACAMLAFATIAFSQVDRVSFIETFTSSTCPPCAPANTALEALIAQPANNGKFVSLKYNVNWPGNGDPYFTSEVNTRRNYYGVNSAPNGFVDAGYDGNPGSLTQSILDGFYGVAPGAELSATYQVDEAAQTVDVQVDFEALVDLPVQFRLFVAIFEYETFNNTGGNGETQFEHVLKKFMTSESGHFLGSMTMGDLAHEEYSYTFNGNYTLPSSSLDAVDFATEHTVEEFSDLGVAIWLQNINTKEVYQAAYAMQGQASVEENVNSITSAKIFPNPTTDNAVIAFHSAQTQDVTIQVINALGQVVFTTQMENVEAGRVVYDLDTDLFSNGMYTVMINANNGSISKKLSVQR
ncbi:MAG: hypothetical protein ACI865_000874 [Flavobacteriaceae bacterium]|jgi:hypothetical protein